MYLILMYFIHSKLYGMYAHESIQGGCSTWVGVWGTGALHRWAELHRNDMCVRQP